MPMILSLQSLILYRQQAVEGSTDGDPATEEARLADWHSGFCVHLVCVPPIPLLLFVFDHVIFSMAVLGLVHTS